MTCCLTIILGFIFFAIAYVVKTKEPPKILGIYAVPGKWYYLKYVAFAALYYFRKVSLSYYYFSFTVLLRKRIITVERDRQMASE